MKYEVENYNGILKLEILTYILWENTYFIVHRNPMKLDIRHRKRKIIFLKKGHAKESMYC